MEKRGPILDRLDAEDIKDEPLKELRDIDEKIDVKVQDFFKKCEKDEFENLKRIQSFYVTFKTELAQFEFRKIKDLQTDMEIPSKEAKDKKKTSDVEVL